MSIVETGALPFTQTFETPQNLQSDGVGLFEGVSQFVDPGDVEEDFFDEKDCVRRAQAGDVDAMGALYEHYVTRVNRFTAARLGNTPDCEDVTSEIMLRMVSRIGSFNDRGLPFGAWLFRIARNEVVTHTRRNKVRSRDLSIDETIHEFEDLDQIDHFVDPFDLKAVTSAVNFLTELQKKVIFQRYIQDKPISQIADELGKTENNIKSTLSKARAKLRFRLELD